MPFDRLSTVPVGLLQVGCHLLWDSQRATGFIVDPGAEADKILAAIAEAGFTPGAILLTHGHVDHISAAGPIVDVHDVPVYLHEADRDLYYSPDNCFLPWLPRADNLPEPTHQFPAFLAESVQVLRTPGHTPGSVCYYLPAQQRLLSGDTLFSGAVGRTDFTGGSQPDLVHSIRDVLYQLPGDTEVLPGHNENTTIDVEKRTNPYVSG